MLVDGDCYRASFLDRLWISSQTPSSSIELGLDIPGNAGTLEYLSYWNGDRLGIPFTWVYNAIAKACAMVITAVIFVENLSSSIMPIGILPVWNVKTCAIPGIELITFITCLGTIAEARRRGGEDAFLILKLFAIFSIAVISILMDVTGFHSLFLRTRILVGCNFHPY